jgi:hypothetical protein
MSWCFSLLSKGGSPFSAQVIMARASILRHRAAFHLARAGELCAFGMLAAAAAQRVGQRYSRID